VPVHYWVPSIATSGLLIYTGDRYPEWRGNFFVGGLAGEQLARLSVEGQAVTGEETLFAGVGRVREIVQAPDGHIYLALDTRGGGTSPILRIEIVD
jgi:glucose/arabinose dehydrogenase